MVFLGKKYLIEVYKGYYEKRENEGYIKVNYKVGIFFVVFVIIVSKLLLNGLLRWVDKFLIGFWLVI